MIVNAAGTVALSNFRWIDAGDLWVYALGESEPKQIHLSDTKRLTPVQGRGDHFAVVHHFENDRVLLTAHSYRDVSETISSIDLHIGKTKSTDISEGKDVQFAGDTSAWAFLPQAYIVQASNEFFLLLVNSNKKNTQIQSLSWYKKSYDLMHQGILGVTEIPGSSLLIVSIQRDSQPVLYDPVTLKVMRTLKLGGSSGSPQLFLRSKAHELWASDYDTLVRLDSRSWSVLDALKLQEAKDGMQRLFIGEYCFNSDESLCAVACPYNGDVVGIDPNNFKVIFRAEMQGQPLEVGLLRDNYVIARDWKTGQLLQGTLQAV